MLAVLCMSGRGVLGGDIDQKRRVIDFVVVSDSKSLDVTMFTWSEAERLLPSLCPIGVVSSMAIGMSASGRDGKNMVPIYASRWVAFGDVYVQKTRTYSSTMAPPSLVVEQCLPLLRRVQDTCLQKDRLAVLFPLLGTFQEFGKVKALGSMVLFRHTVHCFAVSGNPKCSI